MIGIEIFSYMKTNKPFVSTQYKETHMRNYLYKDSKRDKKKKGYRT